MKRPGVWHVCHLGNYLFQKREGIPTSDRRDCSSGVEFLRPQSSEISPDKANLLGQSVTSRALTKPQESMAGRATRKEVTLVSGGVCFLLKYTNHKSKEKGKLSRKSKEIYK